MLYCHLYCRFYGEVIMKHFKQWCFHSRSFLFEGVYFTLCRKKQTKPVFQIRLTFIHKLTFNQIPLFFGRCTTSDMNTCRTLVIPNRIWLLMILPEMFSCVFALGFFLTHHSLCKLYQLFPLNSFLLQSAAFPWISHVILHAAL